MNPYKLREIYKYLTRAKKADPSLPDVFSASKAPIPAKTKDVEEIEAINRFIRNNPRVEKAGGGMLVQPSADGSRPGYSGFDDMNLKRRLDAYQNLKEDYGKKLVEKEFKKKHGTSFENIASKKEYKGRTVTNIIDGFKKQIKGLNRSKNTSPVYNKKTGHIYKTANKFGTFYSTEPKTNQFTGKELTKNKELIANITEDAPFMSQKELIEKYKINKDTLTKIRDQNNLTFRQSYKPTGTQKKEIPYADRYTAQEKSDMYKKRKATETEEDRINARERKKKYEDKVYKEYKMEPSSREPFDDLWKDIARSSKEGDRIQLIEGPKVYSGASYADFKTRVFLDTKTDETFTYDTLKQYLNSGKLEGVTYNSVIKPYDIKNQIAKSGLREDIQKAYFGKKYQPPKRFRSQNTFHVHHIGGVAADPFSVQLTFHDENMGLVHNKKFNENWAKLIERNAPLSERKEYLKFVKKQIGDNIAQTLDFPEVGKTRTFGEIGTNIQKLLSNEKLDVIDQKTKANILEIVRKNKAQAITNAAIKTASVGGFDEKLKVLCGGKAFGGRVGLANGTDPFCPAARQDPEGFLKKLTADGDIGNFFRSAKAVNVAKNVARLSLDAANPFTLLGGEIFYVGLDSANNVSKGLDFDEALDKAFIFYDFDTFDSKILERAKNQGFDENQMNLLRSTLNINKLDNRQKGIEKQFELDESDISGLTSDLTGGSEKDYAKVNKQIANESDKYINSLDKMGFDLSKDESYNTGFNYLNNLFKKKTQSELLKSYENRKRKLDPEGGAIGDALKPIFDTQSYTQPLKFALDIVNPFTRNVGFESDRAKEQRYLNEMDPRELYLYNKERGFTLDDIQAGTSPFVNKAMEDRSQGEAGLGKGLFQNYAGGGIAKLAGVSSGVAPVRGPNPQGLPGLLKRGIKI